jgi:hypothetical protein
LFCIMLVILSQLVDLFFDFSWLWVRNKLSSALADYVTRSCSPAFSPPPGCSTSAVFVGVPDVVDAAVPNLYALDLKVWWGVHVKLLAPSWCRRCCSGARRHRHRHPKVSPLSRSNLLGLMWKICSPCCLACICLCASSDSNWWCPVVSLDLDDISVLSHLLPENWFAGRVFVCLCRILDKSRPTLSQSILGCIVSRNFWRWPYF